MGPGRAETQITWLGVGGYGGVAVTPRNLLDPSSSPATPPFGAGARRRGGAFLVTFHPSMAAPVGPVKFWRPGKALGGLGRCGGPTSVLAPRPACWGLRICLQSWPRRVGHYRAGGLGSLGVHSGPEGFRDPPPAWAEILCDLVTVSASPGLVFLVSWCLSCPTLEMGKSWSAHACPFTALGLRWDWTGAAALGLGVQVRKSDCLD